MKRRYASKLYLTDGVINECHFCGTSLIKKNYTFYIHQMGTDAKRLVAEPILYCPGCHKPFATQGICKRISQKYPKWYISADAHAPLYEKEKKNTKVQPKLPVKKPEIYVMKNVSNNFPLYVSNNNSVINKVCPKCHSVLTYAEMNIPVYLSNGNFYNYYKERVLFCTKCYNGYIEEQTVNVVLNRIERQLNKRCELEFKNMLVKYNERDNAYLYLPTLENERIIYNKDINIEESVGGANTNLNSTSFLYDMGYNIKKDDVERQRILYNAVLQYGKRKVVDYLSFLIVTRSSQENGANKYKNAINIWQQDKNYVVSIRQGGRVGRVG